MSTQSNAVPAIDGDDEHDDLSDLAFGENLGCLAVGFFT